MNQEKIGKLIAKMRKEKGLTQQELGDKVGVGYRAVSKWETGLTLPDISIINELSNILGITADELLKGELQKKPTEPKQAKRKLLLIIPIIIVLATISILFIIKYNKEYKYTLDANDNYSHVEGAAIFKGNKMTLNIDKITFYSKPLNNTVIKNYQYKITSNNIVIFGFGYNSVTESIKEPIKLEELMSQLNIDFSDAIELDRQTIIDNKIILEFVFTDIDDNVINKDIEIILVPEKETSQLDK